MSSNEDEYVDGEIHSGAVNQGQKKRKIQRACDTCRRKKIRCDGPQTTDKVNKCSNCTAYNVECTYDEAVKKRGRPKGYVEGLERRVEKLESLLQRLCPDEDVFKDLRGYLDDDDSILEKMPAVTTEPLPNDNASAGGMEIIRRIASVLGNNDDPFRDDDFNHVHISEMMSKLSVDHDDVRFFGKSSGVMLAHKAMELKNQYARNNDDIQRRALEHRRPQFWTKPQWESSLIKVHQPNFSFPEADLMHELIEFYFQHTNLYLPLLHRPTFERSVAEGLHYRDRGFAGTLLLVCALGARSSSDPRVRLDGVDGYHSNGWKWFAQVQVVQNSLLSLPTLYDLQAYSLAALYLEGSYAAQSCWTIVGIGLRVALDIGAHRRKAPNMTPSVEDELWKRAFWVLLCIDRTVSVFMGRPCAIFDEEIDLDMPIECNDEYWEHSDPKQRFKQPPGVPCHITAFKLFVRLNRILAFALHTIYSIKTKLFGVLGAEWEQHIVAELDSALNKWLEEVPDYRKFRWDPNREDTELFNLAAMLTGVYYHVQIIIHRPFIPSPGKSSRLTFPSLAICTNAARSCSHVMDIQRKRNADVAISPYMQMCAFTSGIVLLLNTWGGKRLGLGADPNKELRNVTKCMELLKLSEERWHPAGRLWDILRELASAGELVLPEESASSTPSPYGQGAQSPLPTVALTNSPPFARSPESHRSIAGSRRARQSSAMSSAESQHSESQPPAQSQMRIPSHPLPSSSNYQHNPNPALLRGQQPPQHNAYSQQPMYNNNSTRSYSQPSLPAQSPLAGGANYWTIPPSQYSSSDESGPSGSSSSVHGYVTVPQVNVSYPTNSQTVHPLEELSTMYEPTAMNYPEVPSAGSAVSGIVPGPSYLTEDVLSAPGTGRVGHPMFVDSDTMSMWMNAPFGFETQDWDTFLASVNELTQNGQQQPSPGMDETMYRRHNPQP